MPSLSGYKSELEYSYAPGIFPSMECLRYRPERVRRVLLHSSAAGNLFLLSEHNTAQFLLIQSIQLVGGIFNSHFGLLQYISIIQEMHEKSQSAKHGSMSKCLWIRGSQEGLMSMEI